MSEPANTMADTGAKLDSPNTTMIEAEKACLEEEKNVTDVEMAEQLSNDDNHATGDSVKGDIKNEQETLDGNKGLLNQELGANDMENTNDKENDNEDMGETPSSETVHDQKSPGKQPDGEGIIKGREGQFEEGAGELQTGASYTDIQIKTIDIPDDDDLSDLLGPPTDRVSPGEITLSQPQSLHEPAEGEEQLTEEEIRSRELYRYLTVQDPTKLHSTEVTPCPSSGGESDSASDAESHDTEHLQSSDEELNEQGSDTNREETSCLSVRGHRYSQDHKEEVTLYAMQHGSTKATQRYKISKSTIQKWAKVKRMASNSPSSARTGRPLSYSLHLEAQIHEYVVNRIKNKENVTLEELRRYGKEVIEPECPDFKASRSWMRGFMKRQNLINKGSYIHLGGVAGVAGVVDGIGASLGEHVGTAIRDQKLLEEASSGESDDEQSEAPAEGAELVKPRRRLSQVKPRADKPGKKMQREPGQLSIKTLERLQHSKEVTDRWLKDLEVPKDMLEAPISMDLMDLNPYLTCGLCKGYLYEASTITECMHTFCKNCIVRHCMEVSLHCPVCNILIHPTDPFIHIRLDRMIQDIVYKILPSVAETEMRNIEAFYVAHPEVEPKEIHEPPSKPKISPRDREPKPVKHEPQLVSLVLEAEGEEIEDIEELKKKYVRVNSEATVDHVCHFLKKKLNLHDSMEVELYCCGDAMEERSSTLKTIKHQFFGDEESLMLLQYRVRDT